MSGERSVNQPQMILIAAAQLEAAGKSPFSIEELAVKAWLNHPQVFGLKGFKDKYPHSNKVIAAVVGDKGMASQGLLVKTAVSTYALTKDGRAAAALARGEAPPARVPQGIPVKVRKDQELFLEHLLTNSAVLKFEANRRAEVSFRDACRFWNISEKLSGDGVDVLVRDTADRLRQFDESLADHDAVLGSGRVVTAGDLRVLGNIHRYLIDRFDRHLNLLRTRKAVAS